MNKISVFCFCYKINSLYFNISTITIVSICKMKYMLFISKLLIHTRNCTKSMCRCLYNKYIYILKGFRPRLNHTKCHNLQLSYHPTHLYLPNLPSRTIFHCQKETLNKKLIIIHKIVNSS